MSHYCCEIVMPSVANVAEAVKQILEPFNEQGKDEDGNPNRHTFWDWYVIGGRFAGAKLEAMLDPEQRDAFYAKLKEMKITVSGIQCGKQELSPPSQIPAVDALWREMFPNNPAKACPFFAHYGDQYKHSDGYPDIMRLSELPPNLEAHRCIIAGPQWDNDAKLAAKTMRQMQVWNGVNYLDTKWDGKVSTALAEHNDDLKHWNPEYAAKHTPNSDWLVVTVDYHS